MSPLRALPALAAALLLGTACPKTGPTLDGGADAGPLAGLEPETWKAHLADELLPYWRMPEAQGSPVGNFPTNRGMNGLPSGSSDRKPRMLGRQVFAYSVGFLLTGDEALLDLARAGEGWLVDHAWQGADGGWVADLDATGAPTGAGDRFAQDFSYAAMGPAAYFYVTRDPAAEAVVLGTRDLLFDPRRFWDADGGRIKDGLDATLSTEAFMSPGGPGSWQLVAQLDPVTGFLLLAQPHLTDAGRRQQALDDLQRLMTVVQTAFWRDGFFWGTTGEYGQWGSQHSDFGHMLKSYWALAQLDKRLPAHPFAAFVDAHAAPTLRLAHDAANGRWAKYPTSPTTVATGSDWWAYAEADQLAATLGLGDATWLPVVATTSSHFRADYVDRTRPARELVSSVDRQGRWVYGWPDSDTAKCNVWKNGFHSTEHALVLYLVSSMVHGVPAELYFAFPADQVATLAAGTWPYTFPGHVVDWTDLGPLAGDASRHKVKVRFDQLR